MLLSEHILISATYGVLIWFEGRLITSPSIKSLILRSNDIVVLH
jgi:hypothetical protein